ncbi:MAG: HEAT repeat domain-containing protein [Solirubrobacteraceae bacterium]
MLRALDIASLGLAAAGILTLAVLTARRTLLAHVEHRRAEAESRLRPLAIAIVEGESPQVEVGKRDARVMAAILSRFARSLRGEARERIAVFFEQRGYVSHELGRLRDRRAWRRASAAFALGDMGSPRAAGALIEALRDSDRDVRTAAARSLGRLEIAEAAPSLVEALASGSVPRAVAGQALISIGPRAAADVRPLLHDGEEAVRRAAAEVLGLIGAAAEAPALAIAARDPAAGVRAAALRALGVLGGRRESDAVMAGLQDEVSFVRTSAAHAAAGLGDRAMSQLLVRQAQDDVYDPALAAARALIALDPRALRAAADSAEASPYIKQAATRAELMA